MAKTSLAKLSQTLVKLVECTCSDFLALNQEPESLYVLMIADERETESSPHYRLKWMLQPLGFQVG